MHGRSARRAACAAGMPKTGALTGRNDMDWLSSAL